MLSTTLSGNYGFPLCISGLSHQLTLSKEMADHDKRRKVMKKRRRSAERREEIGVERIEELWGVQESEDVRDLVALLQDLGSSWTFSSSHTAKAA